MVGVAIPKEKLLLSKLVMPLSWHAPPSLTIFSHHAHTRCWVHLAKMLVCQMVKWVTLK